MKRNNWLLLAGVLASTAGIAADRTIAVPPTLAMSWGYVIPGTQVNPHRTMGVGFWQRSSGAKAGVGAVFVSTIEYQLPEAAPARLRSATFQFSGRPSQCVGAEPVVIDVYAYAGDGKSAVGDASAGSRVAQLSADCSDKAAFARPIDVTAIVRQQSVASGVRFVGFNIRKANNRQGPGLFDLSAGKLTVVLADQAIAGAAQGMAPAAPVRAGLPLAAGGNIAARTLPAAAMPAAMAPNNVAAARVAAAASAAKARALTVPRQLQQ
jgi:hypothetical protein